MAANDDLKRCSTALKVDHSLQEVKTSLQTFMAAAMQHITLQPWKDETCKDNAFIPECLRQAHLAESNLRGAATQMLGCQPDANPCQMLLPHWMSGAYAFQPNGCQHAE